MTENECVYVSVILQLIFDGEAKLGELSPAVKSFVEGIVDEFNLDPDDPYTKELYYAANTMLEFDKDKMN